MQQRYLPTLSCQTRRCQAAGSRAVLRTASTTVTSPSILKYVAYGKRLDNARLIPVLSTDT